jgi:solute carrier family 13 (sodium-dependent dicarboxylate transporter), member 2/3/5
MDLNTSSEFSISKAIGLIAGPLVFIFLLNTAAPTGLNQEAWKVIALAAWMVAWWITEAMPLPVTALLPMIVLPMLGIFSQEEASTPYASPIVFLFMGGFLIALAMEKRNLHSRIALNLIRVIGTNPNGIILGFMIATAFLSMWISNTATAVMMLPIAVSVVRLLSERISEENQKGVKNFSLVLLLSIAYAANIGGTATIIGTPPNVVMVGYINQFYNYDLAFGKYLLVGIPAAIIMLAITYLLLTKILYPNKIKGQKDTGELVTNKLLALGKISRAEWLVAIIFVLTALAWIFRSPINNIIGNSFLNDTLIAMAGGILMFIVPVNFKKGEFIMDWSATKELPWGILLLFGGGLTLAKAMEVTGIIQSVGEAVSGNSQWELWLLLLALTSIMLFMTELMSNVALCVIFLPVVLGIADGLNIPPLMLAIPVTLASSYAFMMPVSTPPNAIVYSSGYISMKQMVKAGFILNLISIILLMILSQTLIPWVYVE